MPKGADFERSISKELSLWWSGDRDDIFWRSSQSGGRATQRFKSGKTTYGSCGDLTALDPIGGPLLKFATIELKRGMSNGVPWDLFESAPSKAVRPFESALLQSANSAEQAGSLGWMMIARRDRKEAMVYLEWKLYQLLKQNSAPNKNWRFHNYVLFNITVNGHGMPPEKFRFKFICVPFKDWLWQVPPAKIIACLGKGNTKQ